MPVPAEVMILFKETLRIILMVYNTLAMMLKPPWWGLASSPAVALGRKDLFKITGFFTGDTHDGMCG